MTVVGARSGRGPYRNSEAGCHAVKIIRMLAHSHDLGHDRIIRPFHAEYLSQFLQILCRSLANGEDSIAEPAHTKVAELLIEEFDPELASKKRYVFDDCKSYTPLLVLSKLNDSGKERLRKKLDANNVVDKFELGNDIESDVGEVVFEHLQEHWEKVIGGLIFAKDRCEAADLGAKCCTNMLGLV